VSIGGLGTPTQPNFPHRYRQALQSRRAEVALHATWISGPVPGSQSIYSIDAKTAADATDDQVRRMFQTLLAERFRMSVHWESKDADGDALALGKPEPNLKEARDGEDPPPLPEWFRGKASLAEL